MSGIESVLPKEYQFDATLDELREPLVDAIWDAKEALNDIVDPAREFGRPYLELWGLSNHLSGMFKLGDETTEDIRAVVYRAMAFGFQVVDDIKCAPIHSLSSKYLSEVFNNDDPVGTIREDVSDYLDARPGISSLLFTFMPEIDETYKYGHHVELSAGLVFMLCEREQAEIYLRVQGDQLNQESI